MAHLLRFKADNKRGVKYTLMVVGSSGTGKTTFVNSLLDTALLPHKYEPLGSVRQEPLVVVGNSGFDSRVFNPLEDHSEATVSITRSTLEVSDEDGSRVQLTVIDTPGFGDSLDNELCYTEIMSYLQQQFDHVLSEETRVRRNPRFDDTRVHICLYFIEPTGHGLRDLDIEAMKKLSKFVNVLPLISRADSFTPIELEAFKKNLLYDIAKYSIPVFQFGYDEEEDDIEVVEENRQLKAMQPFAVMGSREKIEIGGVKRYARRYPWGTVDCEEGSDLLKVKNVLLGSHLQDFKDLTVNFLYENYRSDKLASVSTENKPINAGNPSLSNLAALTLEDSQSTPSLRSSGSFKPDPQSSPMKEVSQAIRDDNESIIQSLKNSPKVPYSPDPSRNTLRQLSETVPYVLQHERILSRQQRLQELEEKSARELALRAAALERKAAELKRRERIMRGNSIASTIKKEDTQTDLASIVNGD